MDRAVRPPDPQRSRRVSRLRHAIAVGIRDLPCDRLAVEHRRLRRELCPSSRGGLAHAVSAKTEHRHPGDFRSSCLDVLQTADPDEENGQRPPQPRHSPQFSRRRLCPADGSRRVPGSNGPELGATDNSRRRWVSGITRGVWREPSSHLRSFFHRWRRRAGVPQCRGWRAGARRDPHGRAKSRWLDATLCGTSRARRRWTWTWVALGAAGGLRTSRWARWSPYHPRVDRFASPPGEHVRGLAVSTLLFPLRIRTDDGALTTTTTVPSWCVVRLLLDAVEREERGRRWFAHALGVVGGSPPVRSSVSVTTTGPPPRSTRSAPSSSTRWKIWTRPRGAVAALRRYREGALPVDGYVGLDVVLVMVGPRRVAPRWC